MAGRQNAGRDRAEQMEMRHQQQTQRMAQRQMEQGERMEQRQSEQMRRMEPEQSSRRGGGRQSWRALRADIPRS